MESKEYKISEAQAGYSGMLSPKSAKGMKRRFPTSLIAQHPRICQANFRHLSRKQTPLTNDPIWMETDVLDREFEADSSLVDAEYRAVADVDKNFSKIVSPSACNYFATICLWYHGELAAEHREGKRDELKRERLALVYG
ncbi:hypothetical protein RUM43_008236 [Polyplax serrata]|uniref:Uncharacterized protein n=1 Tax=Polyplax serrata TaxID=468196 RepID=A0AAN8P716_POLSC